MAKTRAGVKMGTVTFILYTLLKNFGVTKLKFGRPEWLCWRPISGGTIGVPDLLYVVHSFWSHFVEFMCVFMGGV